MNMRHFEGHNINLIPLNISRGELNPLLPYNKNLLICVIVKLNKISLIKPAYPIGGNRE